jgi:predicted site-specific integrase-resolvase
MKAKEVLQKYNISRNTLHHWVQRGKISYVRTPTGHYDYFPVEESPSPVVLPERITVIYARVSTLAQQENLNRQIERLKSFCSARGYILDSLYFDIGSALHYNRKKYTKLYQAILEKKVKRLIIEYKDRLLRFGFEDFERLCAFLGTELIILDHTEDSKSKEKEMTEDLLSIIHPFSMRLYGSRRGKKVISDIENILKENLENPDSIEVDPTRDIIQT